MYDGGLRVPLLAFWKGHTPAGEVNEDLWAAWDFLPTAAALAGLPAPVETDGLSLAPLLRGEETPGHDHLYWEDYNVTSQQAVRLGKWKAIRVGLSERMELYDLESDPGESRDLAETHPEILDSVHQIMEREHSPWDRGPELGVDWERTTRTRLGWVRRNPQIAGPMALAVAAIALTILYRQRRRER